MLSATTRSLRNKASRMMTGPVTVINAPSPLTQQRRNYHENIVQHYENPRNVGSLDKNSDDVGTVSISFFCPHLCREEQSVVYFIFSFGAGFFP
jgi:hypothetical protein